MNFNFNLFIFFNFLFLCFYIMQMDEAWKCVARNEFIPAQHLFSLATSRINSDFIYYVSHFLQQSKVDVMQAPYFSISQLAYLAQVCYEKLLHIAAAVVVELLSSSSSLSPLSLSLSLSPLSSLFPLLSSMSLLSS